MSSNKNWALELLEVSKNYGKQPALRNLNLKVEAGEIFGFLGPNGAGKTTTIRLLLGLLKPDRGQVRVLGFETSKPAQALKGMARVGFLPDNARIEGTFRGQDWLDYLGALQQTPPDLPYRKRLLDRFELSPVELQRQVKTYSRGMRQKLAIIQALQHHPQLLVLDEPTEGLDPLAKQILFETLVQARAEGVTIFFSSHVLSEVERLCRKVALIRNGELITTSNLEDLRKGRFRRVEIEFEQEQLPALEMAAYLQKVSNGSPYFQDGRWRFELKAEINPLLALLAPYPVKDLVIEYPGLEEIFLSYYSRQTL